MKKLRNEQGYALAIAILVITVLSILGISLMATTGNSKKMAGNEQQNQAAYYIAEAGLNLKKAEIKKAADQFRKETAGWTGSKLEDALLQPPKISTSTTYNSKNSNGTNKVFDTANASAKVTVSITPEPIAKTANNNPITNKQNYIYKIKSVGTIDNQKRTLTSTMSYDLTVNSEEQKPEVKPDEEIEGYLNPYIHALEKLEFSGGLLSTRIILGLDKSKYQSNFPFKSDGAWGTYYDKKLNKKYTGSTCEVESRDANYKIIQDKLDKCLSNKKNSLNITYNQKDKINLDPFPTKEFSELDGIKKNFPTESKIVTSSNSVIPSGIYSIKDKQVSKINIGNNDVTLIMSENIFSNNVNISGTGNLKIITNDFITFNEQRFNFDKNNVTIISKSNIHIANTFGNIDAAEIKLIANKVSFNGGGSDIMTKNLISIFANENIDINSNNPFPNSRANIYYKGTNAAKFNDGQDLSANLDFLNSTISSFNITKFSGNAHFRKINPKVDSFEIGGATNTFAYNFIYAPGYTVNIVGGKAFKGSLVAKNINIENGLIEPDQPTPPNDNGSNNGGSIITDSTFSDALDSGTLEIDNER